MSESHQADRHIEEYGQHGQSSQYDRYDVIICGGGLAGQTLARQLRRTLPSASVLILEKQTLPLPIACHKVGESTVEGGTYYLANTLGLADYLRRSHLPKYGLRFFLGDPESPIDQRVEQGAGDWLPIPAYQLDRGILENDLWQMNLDLGVEIRSGCVVDEISLDGDALHEVTYHRCGERGEPRVVRGRWVVDASGRRRLLQRKLGLRRDCGHQASACWWRIPGELDLSSAVSADNRAWHGRVGPYRRWLSTNHIMGEGYWVWLIPLSSGHTSVGIVSDERVHPLRERSSYQAAMAWLSRHQPQLAGLLRDREPLDFKAIKDYAYLATQAFSEDRWSLVGEAAAFIDPMYSTGTDFIAWSNSLTTQLIAADLRGEHSRGRVRIYNQLFSQLTDFVAVYFQDMYRAFASPQVMLRKLVWDTGAYWLALAAPLFQDHLDDLFFVRAYIDRLSRLQRLNRRVQALLREWAAETEPEQWAGFHPLNPMRFVIDLYLSLEVEKTPTEMLAHLDAGLDRCEELAQVLVFDGLRAFGASALARLPEPDWDDAWATELDPERWQREGLFTSLSPARDLTAMTAELESTVLSDADKRKRLAAVKQALRARLTASRPRSAASLR